MISLPKRSVTRFFVPLIDVLILLFCIFLLMPFVSRPGPEGSEEAPPGEAVPKDAAALKEQLADANRRIDRLLKDRANPGDRMSVKVLEIDGATGKLFSFEPDAAEPRQEVRDQGDAQRLIDRHRRLSGTKEPFFLILYPRILTGFPLQRQVDAYRRWFKDVSIGFDNPYQTPAP